MSYYTDLTKDHFLNPRNVGEIEGADARGDAGSLVCGAVVRLSLRIDGPSQTIVDAKFKAAGCGFLIASASILTEMIKGLKVGEAAVASEFFESTFAQNSGELPPDKTHCIKLCREALDASIAHYRTTTLEEWTGEEALICTCFGVSEKSIERAVHADSLRTVGQVTRACNAGGGCRSCHPLIEDILDDYWRSARS